MSRTFVDMAERRLSLSNLEKDLYPSYGFTKAQILEYYRRIAWFILPHLKDRARCRCWGCQAREEVRRRDRLASSVCAYGIGRRERR